MVNVESYQLFLDFELPNYTGSVKIEYSDCDEKLALDCEGLEIHFVKPSVSWIMENQKLVLHGVESKGTLEIGFSGKVAKDALVGIYTAFYENGSIVTTQFEPIYARRLFPCIDHPAYKAKFKLVVSVNEALKVISNMPCSVEKSGNKLVYTFEETPPMSTYLLYLGIGDFTELESGTKPKLILACVKGRESKTNYPLKTGVSVLEFFECYFGIPYPLPKLHFVAVPGTAAGGMENWGAITFGEVYLLADENSPVEQKINCVYIIAHEVAHQWFGDLVTMKWWDDLWLNESFATLMGFKAMQALKPEWEPFSVFVQEEMKFGLLEDSLSTTHPIQAKVNEAHEIEGIFDAISYSKGASVLRMLEAYLGEDAFRRGVNLYLRTHAYSNAEGKHFWGALSQVTSSDVGSLAEEWISKAGYPVLLIEVQANKMKIRQERFSLATSPSETWKVPLTMEVNSKTKSVLLRKEEEVLEFEDEISSFKLNLNRTGFYRVYYSSLDKLSELNAIEKAALLNDYFNFALSGRISFSEYLDVARRYFDEKEFLPVLELSDELVLLYTLSPEKHSPLFREFHLKQLPRWKNKKGEMQTLTYSTLCERLALFDESYALGLSELFAHYDLVEPNLKQAVAYAYAVSTRDFETLFERWSKSSDPEEKMRFLRSLGAIRSEDAFEKLLELTFKGVFKARDGALLIGATSNNPWQRKALLRALISEYEKFEEYSQTLTGYRWSVARFLVSPLSKEGATNPHVERVLEKMQSKETAREVQKIRGLSKAYSRLI